MGHKLTHCAVAMLILAALASPSAAQNPPLPATDNWLSLTLQGVIRGKITWEDVRHRMLVIYLAQDLDGGGISQSDFKLRHQTELAKRRNRTISKWVSYDLDASGDVTRAELDAYFGATARKPIKHHGVHFSPSPEQAAQILEKLVSKELVADGNGDGTITFEEILEHAKNEASKSRRSGYRYRRSTQRPIPMSLDLDKNGTISEAEFMASVDKALEEIDLDSDHQFSNSEIETLKTLVQVIRKAEMAKERERRLEAARVEKAERCAFPEAPANAKILLLGAYTGEALSTVSLDGDDAVVSTANIKIDAGAQPLYIVLTSTRPIIWQVSGATDRIVRIVAGNARYGRTLHGAAALNPRVGVTGVAADRVFFPTAANCLLPFAKAASRQARLAATTLQNLLGRIPDIVTARRTISTVQLPSSTFSGTADYGNTVDVPKDGPTAPIWQKLLRHMPGGLVKLDPKSIVSRAAAKPYKVLPTEAGLAQLVEEGALRPIAPDRSGIPGGTRFIPDRPIEQSSKHSKSMPVDVGFPSEFEILKKMTLPAGLTGAHRTQFVLKPGVPRPDGSSGHSRIRE